MGISAKSTDVCEGGRTTPCETLPKRYRENCVEVKAQPLFNDLPDPL